MPSTIHLVTGGARSGKSSYAQRLCETLSDSPIYLATASTTQWKDDDDFSRRIQKHQADRADRQWTTIEEPLYLSKHVDQFRTKVVLVDCLTLWLTNFMIREGALNVGSNDSVTDQDDNDGNGKDGSNKEVGDASERALEAAKEEFEKLTEQWDITFVFVTNELGSGTHSDNHLTRSFVDMQGWLNQHVAARAERVVYMVCGQALTVKNNDNLTTFASAKKSAPCSQQHKDEARMLDKLLSARSLEMDDKGYFMVSINHNGEQPAASTIVVKFYSCMLNDKGEVCDLEGNKIPCHGNSNRAEPMQIWTGRTAKELTVKIFEQWEHANSMVSVGHASYMGRELQKAEHCLYSGEYYQQD